MQMDTMVIVALGLSFGFLVMGGFVVDAVLSRKFRLRRLKGAIDGRGLRSATAGGGSTRETGAWRQDVLGLMRRMTSGVSFLKDRQIRETRKLLAAAGHRNRDAIIVYTFFKMTLPVIFLVLSGLYVYGLNPIGKGPLLDIGAVVAAALIGSMAPDLMLRNTRDKRLENIRKELPDALDMLVICAEAGLATDAAIKRVVAETSRRSSVLGDELGQTAMELSFMPERRQALENLAERAPLPSIVAFVNTLVQAERYGTPLARAFKVLSQEQRNERMMKAEEKAGRLPATMTVPMMMFILPALFIVLIGPAILDILDNYLNR